MNRLILAFALVATATWPSIGSDGPPAPSPRALSKLPFATNPLVVTDPSGQRWDLASDLFPQTVVAIELLELRGTALPQSWFGNLSQRLGPNSAVRLVSLVRGTLNQPALRALATQYDQLIPEGVDWLVYSITPESESALAQAGLLDPEGSRSTGSLITFNHKLGRATQISAGSSLDDVLADLRFVSAADLREWFTDLPVVDQDGQTRRFYTDVLEGKIVVIDFIFTRCGSICPVLTATMARTQKLLADRNNRDVQLVSISVDPTHDTPEVLKQFGAKFEAKPGWVFLTGNKQQLDWVSYRLGGYTDDKETHLSVFLVGDPLNGRWSKLMGTASADDIERAVRELIAQRDGTKNAL
jgi:protein SCO1/2